MVVFLILRLVGASLLVALVIAFGFLVLLYLAGTLVARLVVVGVETSVRGLSARPSK